MLIDHDLPHTILKAYLSFWMDWLAKNLGDASSRGHGDCDRLSGTAELSDSCEWSVAAIRSKSVRIDRDHTSAEGVIGTRKTCQESSFSLRSEIPFF